MKWNFFSMKLSFVNESIIIMLFIWIGIRIRMKNNYWMIWKLFFTIILYNYWFNTALNKSGTNRKSFKFTLFDCIS